MALQNGLIIMTKRCSPIKQAETSQKRQNQTVTACQAVLESNAYPKLNVLISAFSESMQHKILCHIFMQRITVIRFVP